MILSRRIFGFTLLAGEAAPPAREYLDEFRGTSAKTLALARAIPAEKYAWRPGERVRSTGEVLVHIAGGNLMLLGRAGVKSPAGSRAPNVDEIHKWETGITSKDKIVELLKSSSAAVETAWLAAGPAELARPVDFFGRQMPVHGVYLRILAHTNEHMGQLVAYARVNGIAPPWSTGE